jgi:propionyl-CoA carboxylase alpha chain
MVVVKYIDDELYRQGYLASSNKLVTPRDRPIWISIDGNQTFSHVTSPDLGKYIINEESVNLKAPEINLFDPIIKVFVDNEPLNFQLEEKLNTGYKVRFLGTLYEATLRDNLEHDFTQYIKIKDKGALGNVVTSPMPGHVLKVNVKPGQVIKQGDDLLIVEAMKMQNLIKATRPGKIREIKVKSGDNVSASQLLIEIEDL